MNNICEIKYGLYHIKEKKLLGYSIESNEGCDFCNEFTVRLSFSEDTIWYTDNPKEAEWVRQFEQQWYNSSMDCPMCDYEVEDLKVVEVRIQKEYNIVDIKIPSPFEFYRDKYQDKNPQHWNVIKDRLTPYNIFELEDI